MCHRVMIWVLARVLNAFLGALVCYFHYFTDIEIPKHSILKLVFFRSCSPNLAIMRILTIVLLLALAPISGQAQHTVTGKIVDELGLPIYLASVTLESSKNVVHTDYDGNFSLTSEQDFHWKISIGSAGYKTESFFVLSAGNAGEIILEYGDELRELLINEELPPQSSDKQERGH